MKIALTYKSVFGKDLYYPACDNSRTICKIGGFKSFTPEQLAVMKAAGWQVDIAANIPA